MSKMIEIERKFVVDIAKFREMENITQPGKKVVQAYLNIDEPEISQVRIVCMNDGIGKVSIKGKKIGFSRPEYEYNIPYDDAKELIAKIPNRIYKENIHVFYKGREWLVAIFHEENEGLAIAEVELPSEDTEVEIPEWCIKEVTYDDKYYVKSLAKNPYKNWGK